MKINKIYNEDCVGDKGMCLIPDKSVDMILCDLPYGTTRCKWDSIISFEKLWKQYNRVIKDRGAIVLTASQPFTTALISSNMNMFRYCWVWEKSNPSNIALANKQPLKYHEDICVFYKKQPTYNKQMIPRDVKGTNRILAGVRSGVTFKMSATEHQGIDKKTVEYEPTKYDAYMKNPSTVIKIKVERGKLHPTQKPIKLMEYLIKTYSNVGDVILDNAVGSGTTLLACKNLERNFIGFENSKKYFEIAEERLNG